MLFGPNALHVVQVVGICYWKENASVKRVDNDMKARSFIAEAQHGANFKGSGLTFRSCHIQEQLLCDCYNTQGDMHADHCYLSACHPVSCDSVQFSAKTASDRGLKYMQNIDCLLHDTLF